MKRLLSVLLLLPALAFAGSGSISESGAFASVPGVGYKISGEYTSTAGAFSFVPSVTDNYDADSNRSVGVGLVAYSAFPQAEQDISVTLSLDVRFVDLASGQVGFPAVLFGPSGIPPSYYVLAQGSGSRIWASAVQEVTPELRFSYSSLAQSTVVSDQNHSISLDGASSAGFQAICDQYRTCESVSMAPSLMHLDFTATFKAGNFLTPSLDPSCASLSCMASGHDSLIAGPFAVGLSVSAVPEVSSLVLSCLGIAVLLPLARRRQRAEQA